MGHNGDERPVGALLGDAARQFSQLARQEMELARMELHEDMTHATSGMTGFGLAGGAALVAVLLFALGAMFGIAVWLPLWAAALIVGGVGAAVAGLLAMQARRAIADVGPPRRTVDTLKEDVRCLRHPIS